MRIFFIVGFLCLACYTKSQVPYEIPSRGLQCYWPFTGNANDVSGNSRHGKTHGVTLANDRFGNKNNAYYFNGASDFILTPYEGVLGSHARAVSFWAIVYNNRKGQAAIAWGNNAQFPNNGGRFGCSFGGCFVCDPEDHFIGATIEVSDAGITFEGQEPVTDGRWHHYVYQFDKKYVRDVEIYQDGALLTHESYRFYKNCLINTKRDLNVIIGALLIPGDTISYFKGFMDDIAIYNRVLSSEEIKALYLAPDPNKKTDLLKWVPVFFAIILFILMLVWFIRLRVKKLVAREKEKIQLNNKWYEQENRIIKAQMNPHFIFNSLNTIQQFIIVNDNEKAQLYLSTFSRLIRMQLESNTSESISLKQEIEIYEKYLEIESLRFNNAFDYEIKVADRIIVSAVYIPHFLIQPFIENAIHHGLLPKLGYKKLEIIFEQPNEKTLTCIINDNGVGRKESRSREIPDKTKSLGVNFVQQRLNIMSKMNSGDFGIEITDKLNEDGSSAGTRVLIKMPIINNYA